MENIPHDHRACHHGFDECAFCQMTVTSAQDLCRIAIAASSLAGNCPQVRNGAIQRRSQPSFPSNTPGFSTTYLPPKKAVAMRDGSTNLNESLESNEEDQHRLCMNSEPFGCRHLYYLPPAYPAFTQNFPRPSSFISGRPYRCNQPAFPTFLEPMPGFCRELPCCCEAEYYLWRDSYAPPHSTNSHGHCHNHHLIRSPSSLLGMGRFVPGNVCTSRLNCARYAQLYSPNDLRSLYPSQEVWEYSHAALPPPPPPPRAPYPPLHEPSTSASPLKPEIHCRPHPVERWDEDADNASSRQGRRAVDDKTAPELGYNAAGFRNGRAPLGSRPSRGSLFSKPPALRLAPQSHSGYPGLPRSYDRSSLSSRNKSDAASDHDSPQLNIPTLEDVSALLRSEIDLEEDDGAIGTVNGVMAPRRRKTTRPETEAPSTRAEKGSEKCDSIHSTATDHPTPDVGGIMPNGGEICDFNLATLCKVLEISQQQLSEIDIPLLNKALLDCYGRFLLNLPPSLLQDHVHLHFQVQEGHWWYEDFWYDAYPDNLPKINLKSFGLLMCESFSVLRECVPEETRGRLLKDWVIYCRTIPLRGAIILNMDLTKCLLVQGWKGSRWTFPRGKVDEQESDETCAVREVIEEIGFDVSALIAGDLFIERRLGKQCVKLFIICGVPENTTLEPQKRKEISAIRWFPINSLPESFKGPARGSAARTGRGGGNKNSGRPTPEIDAVKSTHVTGFIKGLKTWLHILRARLADFGGVVPNDPRFWTSHLEWAQLRRLQHPDGLIDSSAADAEEDLAVLAYEQGIEGIDRQETTMAKPDVVPPIQMQPPIPAAKTMEPNATADELFALLVKDRASVDVEDAAKTKANAEDVVKGREGDKVRGFKKPGEKVVGPNTADRPKPIVVQLKAHSTIMKSVGVLATDQGLNANDKSLRLYQRKKLPKSAPIDSMESRAGDRSQPSKLSYAEKVDLFSGITKSADKMNENDAGKEGSEAASHTQDVATVVLEKRGETLTKPSGDQDSPPMLSTINTPMVSNDPRLESFNGISGRVYGQNRAASPVAKIKLKAAPSWRDFPRCVEVAAVKIAPGTKKPTVSTNKPLTILKRGEKV